MGDSDEADADGDGDGAKSREERTGRDGEHERVLVPTDGSPQSRSALDYALREFPEAEVIVLTVINPVDAGFSRQAATLGDAEGWYEGVRADAEELLAEVESVADDAGVAVDTAIEMGRPARTIVEYADAEDVDQIVIGSHGRSGVARILLGSVAESVVRRSPVPVTIVR